MDWLSLGMAIQRVMTGIANVKYVNGQLISDPGGINGCFASFYRDLYSSRARYTGPKLQAFLEDIQLPTLSEEARRRINAPLTLKEALASRPLEVLSDPFKASSLPPSMSMAIIDVIPKLGKDPELCYLYRPISLLNVDMKNLAKMLATCLNKVILSLVHRAQTRFMLGY